jgi:hypothetical protein
MPLYCDMRNSLMGLDTTGRIIMEFAEKINIT